METPTRYFRMFATHDHFDGWVVTRSWGGKPNRTHGGRRDVFMHPESAADLVCAIERRRLKHNYR